MHQDCIFLQWTALNPKASVQGLHCRTQRGSRGNRCTRTPSPAPMQNRVLVKVGVAGGAVYVAYDEGLLGSGEKGSEVLRKAKAAIPPAVDEWMKYFGWELPAPPQIEFSPSQAWNSGVQTTMSALSVAPSRAQEYTQRGWQYVKDLTK